MPLMRGASSTNAQPAETKCDLPRGALALSLAQEWRAPANREFCSSRRAKRWQGTWADTTVIRHLADTDRADRLGHALAMRGQNINLPQFGDDLLRLVALPRHRGPPGEIGRAHV